MQPPGIRQCFCYLRSGKVEEIAENGLLLAATERAEYTQRSMQLKTGDRLLLYTDGLVEAKDGSGQMFGDEALASALRSSAGFAPRAAAERIIAEVQQWAKSQEDDLTALVCDFVAVG